MKNPKRARTVVLTGLDLSVREVVAVARGDAPVAIDRAAAARMRKARRVVERVFARGETVYGMNTGVAAKKRHRVHASDIAAHNRLLIQSHRVGQGEGAARDVVRAALLRIANGFALGTTTASLELAQRVVAALNDGLFPRVRLLGSVGESDLAPNADLADGLLGDYVLGASEALVLLNNAGFSSALATLAVSDTARLLGTLEVAGALDLEAFGANLSILDPAVAEARPYPGHLAASRRLRALLKGSALWQPGVARNLQDPLTFRGMPQMFGAARDALGFVFAQLSIELNSAHDNPLVVADEERILSVWNGEIVPLAAALDFLRIALAPVLTSANERIVKLLQAPLSGLPGGLAASAELAEDGLAEFGVAAQALAAEARLLAQPVSFELASTTQAEGIEDRTTMAPLAARRLAEMVSLGERLCAIELLVAAQAIDLRKGSNGKLRLGTGTARAFAGVRDVFGFTGRGESIPVDLEPLVERIRAAHFSPPIEPKGFIRSVESRS